MNSPRYTLHAPLNVLVVEDDYLLSEALVDSLTKLGCTITACASNLEQAMTLAREDHCDVAIVDIDLRGLSAYPVLVLLRERGINFVIASGTELGDLPRELANAPVVSKPYDTHELFVALSSILERGALQI